MRENESACTSLNEYLWETNSDLTTRPIVWLVFAFFYSAIFIIGVTGNLCVILAITRTKWASRHHDSRASRFLQIASNGPQSFHISLEKAGLDLSALCNMMIVTCVI